MNILNNTYYKNLDITALSDKQLQSIYKECKSEIIKRKKNFKL